MPDIITITALIYTDSDAADGALRDVAMTLMARGCRLAGLVQHNTVRPGRSRCDMVLEELASGELIGISQDRGPLARGCALDVGQLLGAMQIVRAALDAGPDLVILNKFGKTEAEGAGFRPLIAETIEAGLPLLIAVPWRNIESWRLFAGAMAREIDLDQLTADGASLSDALGLGHGSVEVREPEIQPILALLTRH
jgi:nucleoside-triphosphatase THEP1